MTPSAHHLQPIPPPVGPMLGATVAFAFLGGAIAYIATAATGTPLPAESVVGYAVSCAQIGAGFLAIAARGNAVKALPRANRFLFMVALGLVLGTGLSGVAIQAVPTFRALPAGPAEFIAWTQYVGFPVLGIGVLYYLAWCSRVGHAQQQQPKAG